MQLPIIAYGAPILRKVASNIDQNYPDLKKLIEDMWETLYNSNGVGLAAPQINRDIRLFLVDSEVIFKNQEPEDEPYPDAPGIKRVFINAKITKLEGEPWPYNEGCLSIPKINEDVIRPESVTLEYLDEDFKPHTETFIGMTARIIQHEYDHIEGKLFIDYLKPLKKKMLQRKLTDISKGKVQVGYKMLFPKK
ncbi:peptide deformylase [Arachidicoccus rhizosphaerae]|uniref:Peptide deformylase n=1 Tax=Arachidicoccus rhizosphaerae TaxID=551991 RepID=A0A1H3ZAA2_9BACT|nr:peptide deformylase [Arachidicoccus rhizosphaerae]SEA20733.1 peptide deformylase [Arachidicoccus rhizosphaerae]